MVKLSQKKVQVKREHVQNRTFKYTKNDVTLDFSLRTDIKQQLKDFKECLEAALVDVEAEINSN